MGAQFILVGLLCLCGLSLGCKRELLVNVDFPGGDIALHFSPDAEHCQLLCTQQPYCRFFTFLRSDWTGDHRQFHCYLKSSPSGKPHIQKPLQGHTSGFSLKPCSPDPKPCLSKVYQDVDFPRADYRFLFTADYEECQRACTQEPGCQFFTFLTKDFPVQKWRFKCHLKTSWTVPWIPVIHKTPNIISGLSQRLQNSQYFNTACEGKFFPNTDIRMHNLGALPAISPEHCQALCSAHPICTYFSYVSHSFTCFLKHGPGEMVQKAVKGIISGLPARFCRLDDHWIRKSYVGVNLPGYDLRFFLTDDVELCQRACTEDPNCQFYSYVTAAISHSIHRRRCYLKRAITMPAPPRVIKGLNHVSGFSLRNCHYKDIV